MTTTTINLNPLTGADTMASNRRSFYTVTFTDADGVEQVGRTFAQERNARKAAERFVGYYGNARILKGGPGGQCILAKWAT